MTSKAIERPPDAEPVIPASTLTATASETSGYRLAPRTQPWIARKPGMVLITLPKPTSDAVLKIARRAPVVARESEVVRRPHTHGAWTRIVTAIPSTRATIKAHEETTALTASVGNADL